LPNYINILIPLSMVVGVYKQQQFVNKNGRFLTWLSLNISVDQSERGRTSHSSCWMCLCTLINQFIKLEQRKSLQN